MNSANGLRFISQNAHSYFATLTYYIVVFTHHYIKPYNISIRKMKHPPHIQLARGQVP